MSPIHTSLAAAKIESTPSLNIATAQSNGILSLSVCSLLLYTVSWSKGKRFGQTWWGRKQKSIEALNNHNVMLWVWYSLQCSGDRRTMESQQNWTWYRQTSLNKKIFILANAVKEQQPVHWNQQVLQHWMDLSVMLITVVWEVIWKKPFVLPQK